MLSNGWHLVHSRYRRHTISYGTQWPCERDRQAPCAHGTYGHSVVTACTQHTGPVTLWTWHQVDRHRTAHSTGLMCTEHAHCVRCTWSPCGHCVNTAHTVVVWPRHGTVAMWSRYTDTVTTQCVLLPCGYGTPIQCPHVWLPCGHGIPTPCQHRGYSCCVATVHEHRAHLVQIPWPHGDRTPRGGTVAVYRVAMACVTATVPNLWHGVRVPCPHGNCTYRMATACVYRGHTATVHGVWHWHCATTVATVTVRPWYMDTLPTWYRHRGHTATVHHVVARWPCTVSTWQLYIPCGHSVGVPWPHGDCTYCLGKDIVPTPCLRLPCGHGTRCESKCGFGSEQ